MFSKKNSFFKAVERGDIKTVKNLLSNASFKKKYLDIEIPDKKRTPLTLAIYNDNTEMAMLLINHGANIYIKPSYYMSSAVSVMAYKENYDLITTILKNKITTDKKLLPILLITATKQKNIKLVKSLIKYGGDVNTVNIDDISLLSIAVKNEDIKFVEFLIKEDADVNHKDYKRYTPSMYAAYSGNLQIIKILVKHDGYINDQCSSGESLISIAANNRHHHIIEYLVEQGANIDSKDNNGETPLVIAAKKGRLQTVELLLKKGANPHARSQTGLSIFELIEKSKGSIKAKTFKHLLEIKEKLHEDTNTWTIFGEDKVAHIDVSPTLERRITEIFNFSAKTHFVISENLNTKTESISSLMPFIQVDEKALKIAFAAYKEQGGKIEESQALKNISHKRILK